MSGGSVIPFFVAGTILFVIFVFFLVMFLIVQKNKQNKHAIEKNKMIYDHENKLLRTRTEEQERTMNAISMEIHDNVNQILNFARMNLHVINRYASMPEQKELIQQTGNMLEGLIKDVHNISHSLNSEYVKGRGLIDTLQQEAERMNNGAKLKCVFELSGEHRPISADKELMIFRIVQEASNNTLKHANATLLNIRLNYEPAALTLIIKDNGKGFQTQSLQQIEGIGMINMYQRAKVMGGRLSVDSSAENGTSITLYLPLNDQKVQVAEPEAAFVR